MKTLTTHERMQRMYEHRDADRIPIKDYPWNATVERWRAEGLPEGVSWSEHFDLDRFAGIGADNSPRFPVRTIEETEEYRIYTSQWGATLRDFKHSASVPEFLGFTVTGPDSWREAKARMTPTRDRIDWDGLKRNYARWRKEGSWITAGFWFGFDVAHSWMVGTEQFLIQIVENPDWCVDVFNTYLDMDLALFQMVWDEGYHFDSIYWSDDMGYKHNQFFSVATYRELLKPVHKRAIDWAHAKGVKAHLHSCGDINPFVPELLDIGVDALNPLEVKAGMDPLELKRTYGDRLVLHGGINAVNWDKPDVIRAEIEQVVPRVKENGGYIFSSDHSIPSSVGLKDFGEIIGLVKRLGTY